MKHFLFAVALICFGSSVAGAVDSFELPISSVTAPAAVSVSSSAWTNVTPAAVKLQFMSGILIDNPSTNNAAMHGFISDCTTPTASTVTIKGPIELPTANSGGFVSITEEMCLWLVGRHTAAESVMVQGVKQLRKP